MKINANINEIFELNNSIVEYCNAKWYEYRDEIFIEPLVTGDDLIEMGYYPSRRFSEILFDVENEQLENKIKSKSEAISYVKTNF